MLLPPLLLGHFDSKIFCSNIFKNSNEGTAILFHVPPWYWIYLLSVCIKKYWYVTATHIHTHGLSQGNACAELRARFSHKWCSREYVVLYFFIAILEHIGSTFQPCTHMTLKFKNTVSMPVDRYFGKISNRPTDNDWKILNRTPPWNQHYRLPAVYMDG